MLLPGLDERERKEATRRSTITALIVHDSGCRTQLRPGRYREAAASRLRKQNGAEAEKTEG